MKPVLDQSLAHQKTRFQILLFACKEVHVIISFIGLILAPFLFLWDANQ